MAASPSRRSIVEILITAKDATAGAIRSALGALGRLKDRIFSLTTLIQGFASYLVVRAVKDVVGAFAKQEQSVIRLNTALRVTGRYSAEGTDAIQRMAKEMQHLTTVSEQEATSVSATIAQLATQLTPQQLADVQKAAIGLAQTFGIDLQSAAVLVGKALAGERDVLSRYNVTLDTTATQQDRFNQLMQKTAGFFDVAVGSTKSLQGQFAQAANATDDFKQVLGQIFAESLGLNDPKHNLTAQIEGFTEKLRSNMPEIVHWGQVVVAIIKAIAVSAFELFKLLVDGAKDAWDGLRALFEGLRGAAKFFLGDWKGAAQDFAQAWVDANRSASLNLAAIAEGIAKIDQAWSDVGKAIEKKPLPLKAFGFSHKGGGANTPPDPRQAAEQSARDLTNQATTLAQKFDAGRISVAEFLTELDKVAPGMNNLLNSGLLTDETLISLAGAFNTLRDKAVALQAVTGSDEGPGGFLKGFNNAMIDGIDSITHLQEQLGDLTYHTLVDFTSAIAAAFEQLTIGSANAAKAFEAGMLQALASVARSYGDFFAGKAAAEIAQGIAEFPFGSQHFVSAGEYFAAAGAMYAVAGGIGGAASRTAGGGGGGGQATATQRTGAVSGTQGTGTIVVEGGILDMSDPRQADALARAVNKLKGLKILIEGK